MSGLVVLGSCAKKDPHPLTAGNYKGRLYIYYFYPTKGISYQRVVDTTIAVTTNSNASLSIFNQQLHANATGDDWRGHRPARSNYAFDDGFSSKYIFLQKEQSGDSIYAKYHNGGLGSYTEYTFYAAKR